MIEPSESDTLELLLQQESDLLNAATATIIYNEEMKIFKAEKVYLMTWSPDPKELPNADFQMQHNYSLDILSQFLTTMRCGLLCVEATQLGNPHYHGWYQLGESKYTKTRLAITKTLQRIGNLRITEARSVKPGLWTERKNGLYYYKKDSLDDMILIKNNPITKDSKFEYNWISSVFFSLDLKNTSITTKISDKQFYLQFYSDSTL